MTTAGLLAALRNMAEFAGKAFVACLIGCVIVFTCYVLMVTGKIACSGPTKSKVEMAAGDITAMNSAIALYQVDVLCKQFPATTLMQLYSDNAAGWSGPYLPTITVDPWGNAYTYTSSGLNYTIQSVHDSDYNKAETIRYVARTGVMESIP